MTAERSSPDARRGAGPDAGSDAGGDERTLPPRRTPRWVMLGLFVVTLVVALTLAVTTCGMSSGVKGTVVEIAKTNYSPQAGVTVEVHEGDAQGKVVARTTSDVGGAFSIDVSPGTYALSAPGATALPETVDVKTGHYAIVKLLIRAK